MDTNTAFTITGLRAYAKTRGWGKIAQTKNETLEAVTATSTTERGARRALSRFVKNGYVLAEAKTTSGETVEVAGPTVDAAEGLDIEGVEILKADPVEILKADPVEDVTTVDLS